MLTVRVRPSELRELDRVRGRESRGAFMKRAMQEVVKVIDELKAEAS